MIESANVVEKALAFENVNIVGAEIIAALATDELFADEAIAAIHEKGLYCWVNSISLGNFNKHDDSPRNDRK